MKFEIQVASCIFITALLTQTLPAQETLVQYRAEVRDLGDTPINTIGTGEDFWLYMFVSDQRAEPFGVFAAFVDVSFESHLATPVTGELEHLPTYDTVPNGDVLPGFIDEAGGLDGFSTLGGGEFGVFRLLLNSTGSSGDVINFVPDPADDKIQHATLIFLDDDPVPISQIDYQGATLTIVPEPSTWMLLACGFAWPVRRLRWA